MHSNRYSKVNGNEIMRTSCARRPTLPNRSERHKSADGAEVMPIEPEIIAVLL